MVEPAEVIRACHALGFALAGVAPAEPTRRRQPFLDWLAAGKHGDMEYLTQHLDERMDVRALLPAARSVIVVADQYGRAEAAAPDEPTSVGARIGQGLVARYARGRDYHTVMRRRLWTLVDGLRARHPGSGFRPFVDTGPVLEREQAVRAGMVASGQTLEGRRAQGFIGKHTLYIHPSIGSYVLLGGIATTLDLTGSKAAVADTDRCGSCTRCIEACPTGAIASYTVDATRCVSYLTLEHRGVIDPGLHAGIGHRVIGCDVCQEVCPFNQSQEPRDAALDRVHPAYADPTGKGMTLDLLEVLRAADDAPTRQRLLGGSAGKRASMEMLRRNALIAAGNQISADTRLAKGSPAAEELEKEVRRIAADEGANEMVRSTARQVLLRIDQRTTGAG